MAEKKKKKDKNKDIDDRDSLCAGKIAKPRNKWQIDFKYNFKIYTGFLKKYWPLIVIIMIVLLVIEAAFLMDKFLFKIVIDKGTAFLAGTLAKDAYTKILITVAIVFVSIVIFRSFMKWIRIHLINILESKLIADLKRRFFNHIINLSHSFHTSHKTGSLISKLLRGAGSMERMTDSVLFSFVPLLFNLVVVSISILYFDWVSALTVFLTAVAFLAYTYWVQIWQKEANIKVNEAEDFEKANISDFLINIDSIKYFGKESRIESRYHDISERTKKYFLRHWHYFRWLDSVQEVILGLGTFLIILFPILGLLNGHITIGTLVFIYTAYYSALGTLMGFGWGIRGYYLSMADFDALFRYGKVEQDVKDKKGAEKLLIKNGNIEFNNMTFKYGPRTLFKNFSLKIPKNKKIALVGHSGCGKTTLIKLLYRFYDVNEGAIMVDDKDIRDFKQESLREEMAIVPQECVLFDDTIYNNIAFSKPGATRAEVLEAIMFAQLDEIIKSFPCKENTIVGERGVKLSGGEKQRVSIARALLADKKVLVLDEATSSLDSQTEHEIQRDLYKLMEGRTTIIIAHRLSTVMNADEIVVLEKGKIVQKGKHLELIRQKGIYKQLWDLQKGGYIE
jgi:ATP-binding cassette, subfamily B, heavy metal transporter